MLTVANHTFVIPQRSGFVISDLGFLPTICRGDCACIVHIEPPAHIRTSTPAWIQQRLQFDLVLMDPPWGNKSATRSSAYDCMDNGKTLSEIPLKRLVSPGGLVAVWVTNKPRLHTLVRERIFRAWDVEPVAEWVWIKVTNDGVPVIPLDNVHRKPYECLIIGQRRRTATTAEMNAHCDQPALPASKVIVSVPSRHHSQKPFIHNLLGRYIGKGIGKDAGGAGMPQRLELFARQLMPGWRSWGNEAIRFNDKGWLAELAQ
ncbi:MT-A70-domain-containing protein [Entophlyctis helioformis]|nr:MT-A70-domain-containing protein [Entophlyctis helioformis]